MLEFSISNQLLSRLDATKVVADSENYLECSFQFSGDWHNTVAVATFGHSKVQEPISVRIVEGKCRVPHEVIKTYGFQVAVYGTAEEETGAVSHIPTNVVTVEVETSGVGGGLGPNQPTQSMYDSLMTAIAQGEAAASAAKTSAQGSAEAAMGAHTGAEDAMNNARKAAENAGISAATSAREARNAQFIWETVRDLQREVEALAALSESYAVGSGEESVLSQMEDIPWQEGKWTGSWIGLQAGRRYRVRVDGTWYEAVARMIYEERAKTNNDQAELSGLDLGRSRPEEGDETPEIPEGDEVNPAPGGDGGGETPETPGGDETPEIPGGDEVDPPSGGEDDGSEIPVVKPILIYETLREIVTLSAGPVTLEDVAVDKETEERFVCRVVTEDPLVREVEVRSDGCMSAKYFCQRAEAAAERAEARA